MLHGGQRVLFSETLHDAGYWDDHKFDLIRWATERIPKVQPESNKQYNFEILERFPLNGIIIIAYHEH